MSPIWRITAEQQALADQALRFAKTQLAPLATRHEHEKQLTPEAWQRLAEFGALGLPFAEKYGGAAVEPLGSALVGEAFGRGGADGGLMLSWGAHSFLCGATLAEFGDERQKARYLPKLATAEMIGAFGLTEPAAGSDAAGIRTTYRAAADGFVLNGQKTYITNAPTADVFLVFATKEPALKHLGISAFIVERPARGLTCGKPMDKVCVRGSGTGEVFFEDCFVPAENVLGAEGLGFVVALSALEWDRSVLMAPFVGKLAAVLDEAAAFALQREQFGRPIAKFHAVRAMLARLAAYVSLARLMTYRIAARKGEGGLHHLEAATAKLFGGGRAAEMASLAVQLFGGAGLLDELGVERIYRDAKLGSIGGGTSEIQCRIIARTLVDEPQHLEPRTIVENAAPAARLWNALWTCFAQFVGLLRREADASGKPWLKGEPLAVPLAEIYSSLDACALALDCLGSLDSGESARTALAVNLELRHALAALHTLVSDLAAAGLPPQKSRTLLDELRDLASAPPSTVELSDRLAELVLTR